MRSASSSPRSPRAMPGRHTSGSGRPSRMRSPGGRPVTRSSPSSGRRTSPGSSRATSGGSGRTSSRSSPGTGRRRSRSTDRRGGSTSSQATAPSGPASPAWSPGAPMAAFGDGDGLTHKLTHKSASRGGIRPHPRDAVDARRAEPCVPADIWGSGGRTFESSRPDHLLERGTAPGRMPGGRSLSGLTHKLTHKGF